MNSLPKFTASIAALIASLAFAWIAFSVSRAILHNGLEIQFNDKPSDRFTEAALEEVPFTIGHQHRQGG